MNGKQFGLNYRRAVALVLLAPLLILTALPALASDDPGRPADQPVRCYVVVPGAQGRYSDDCFGPGEFRRLPLVIAASQDRKLTRSKDKE